jgi:PAS domain-containing protein
MRFHETQAEAVSSERHSELISRYVPREYLLSAVDASAIGIVICDRSLRYKALNRSVAKIHNVPVEAHLGHKFHEILGNMADKVAPVWENVFCVRTAPIQFRSCWTVAETFERRPLDFKSFPSHGHPRASRASRMFRN